MSVYDVERIEEHDPTDPSKVEFKLLSNIQSGSPYGTGGNTGGQQELKQQL